MFKGNQPPFRKIIHDIIGTRQPDIQKKLLREWIEDNNEKTATDFILYLWTGTLKKETAVSEVYMSFIQLLHDSKVQQWDKLMVIKDYASESGIEEVFAILDPVEPVRNIDDDIGAVENIGMEDVALGVKKSLAKGLDRRIINRLIHEQDESVIMLLLKNPNIVEMDVIKIATKRPTSSRVLMSIFQNRKWISRYPVKRALILNPYNLPQISAALLPFLKRGHIKEVAQDSNLYVRVSRLANRILEGN